MTQKNEDLKKKPLKPLEELTEKQQLFIKYYNANGNAGAAAARAAGYAKENARHQARELLNTPHIIHHIKKAEAVKSALNVFGEGDVLEMLRDMALDNETTDKSITMQALSMYMKSTGMTTDRQEVHTTQEVKHTFTSQEAEEFLKSQGIDPSKL